MPIAPRAPARDDTTTSKDSLARADERIRQAAFVYRLVAAVTLVALSPLLERATHEDRIQFAWVVALAWIPAAAGLEMLRRRRRGRFDLSTLILDFTLVTLFLFHFEVVTFILIAQLLVVAYYTHLGGWNLGVAAALVAVAVSILAALAIEPADWSLVTVFYPVALIFMVLLMLRIGRRHGEAVAILARVHDKAAAIATGVAEAVVVTAPRGRIREWNSSAEVTFECATRDAVGRSCAEALGLRRGLEQLDCSGGCALLRAQLDDGGTPDTTVWRPDPRDPEARQALLAHVAPIADETGAVVEVVHSFRDVSRLMEADEAKTVFLATASHELKTPLTVIMGFAELMARRPDLSEDDRAQAIGAIQDRARQLTDIVDRLLLTSRIEAGRVDLDLGPIGVKEMVEERSIETLAAVGRRPVLSVPDEVPLAIADEEALPTVLDHLFENAVKYSASDQPVEVVVTADPTWVSISVTDHGIGMSSYEVDHCLDRFWQAESGDMRRYGGTGIGLYVVKSLVQAMHGDLHVTSERGEGSTFTVRLRRADLEPMIAEEVAPEMRPEPSIIREFMRQVGIGQGSGR